MTIALVWTTAIKGLTKATGPCEKALYARGIPNPPEIPASIPMK